MLSGQGKYATATRNRRFVWDRLVWPLVLETGRVAFTSAEYRAKRDEVCGVGGEAGAGGVGIATASRGLASLLQKGLLRKEGDLYSIHYRLVPYMRLGAACGYATAIHEVRAR